MKLRDAARLLRKQQTPAERRLWEALRHHRLDGLQFRRQQPIGKFIADFYCHAARLVVEVDGGIHNSLDQTDHDRDRDMVFAELGLQVLRVSNDEVVRNLPAVLAHIRERCRRLHNT